MKEYIEPVVEVIELPKEDVIVTSTPGPTIKEDIGLPGESILGASKAPAKNGMRFD